MSNLIPRFGFVAGLADVYLVEQRYLRQLPLYENLTIINPLQLPVGRMFSLLRSTIFSAAFDTDAGTTLQGNTYKHEVAGFFPGEDPIDGTVFARYNGRRFVVLVRGFDGQMRLVGDPLSGLEFSSKFTSGTKPGQKKGWSWSLAGITQGPALYYNAPFEVEELGTVSGGAGTGSIQVRDRSGNLRASVPAGRTLVITSGFRVALTII